LGEKEIELLSRIWEVDVKSANMEIKEYCNKDGALFHYTKLSTAIEDILPDKRLKLSRIQDSTDPAESNCKFLGMQGSQPSEIIEERFAEMHNTVNSPYRKLSFCSNKAPTLVLQKSQGQEEEIPDQNNCSKGWEKARMWEQYAESQTGICFVFSKEKLKENLKNTLATTQYLTGYIKYYYRDKALNVLSTSKLKNDSSGNYRAEYVEKMKFQKHIDYRDEAEYQVIVFNPEVEYIDITKSIKAVIAGVNTPKIYDKLIKKLCNSLKCEFLKVFKDPVSCKFYLRLYSEIIKL
jgi:hypothetical protein